MATRANIKVEGIYKGGCVAYGEFQMHSDGGEKEIIHDALQGAVDQWKGEVKSSHLAKAVINQLAMECASEYSVFDLGLADEKWVGYTWKVTIGPRGGIKIREE